MDSLGTSKNRIPIRVAGIFETRVASGPLFFFSSRNSTIFLLRNIDKFFLWMNQGKVWYFATYAITDRLSEFFFGQKFTSVSREIIC